MSQVLEKRSLVTILAAPLARRPGPDDLDIITKNDGETDRFVAGLNSVVPDDDLDIVTRSDGEHDSWMCTPSPDPDDDLDIITHNDGETDRWYG